VLHDAYSLSISSSRNVNPTLPYDDNSFDVVTCVVSIDYLIKPIEVLKEVGPAPAMHYCSLCLLYFTAVVR
jgi:hypothetical protein